jgi:hypothetical protein
MMTEFGALRAPRAILPRFAPISALDPASRDPI